MKPQKARNYTNENQQLNPEAEKLS